MIGKAVKRAPIKAARKSQSSRAEGVKESKRAQGARGERARGKKGWERQESVNALKSRAAALSLVSKGVGVGSAGNYFYGGLYLGLARWERRFGVMDIFR